MGINESEYFRNDQSEQTPKRDAENSPTPIPSEIINSNTRPARKEIMKKKIRRMYCPHRSINEHARVILSSEQISVRDLRVVWSTLTGPHKSIKR